MKVEYSLSEIMARYVSGLIVGAALGIFLHIAYLNSQEQHVIPGSSSSVTPSLGGDVSFEQLLDAIEQVESGGDPWAVGDGGDAVGSFQIHKIYLDDVNRILCKRPATSACLFHDKDRRDPKKSREMVTIFLKHYSGTFEEMARKHNGGPAGHRKECTKPYWAKVKTILYSSVQKKPLGNFGDM